ncbi:MAG: CHAT domain-containing protein [Thiotrichaceae bacterium]|nr:CHAT domain-containing protein [Thiotrichaceae bacterium]
MGVKPFIIAPLFVPKGVDELTQQVKSGFQHKTINSDLLKKMGQQLWNCSALTSDMSCISHLIIQQHFNLPWECLYHPDGYFIAQKIPIIRQMPSTSSQLQQTHSPLKILHFATQAEHPNKNPLNLAEEQYFIYQALWAQIQTQQILLHSSQCGDFERFQDLLNQHWDIIILTAHSITKHDQQSIIFNSETASYQLISYKQIISVFQKSNVNCVILAICESADLALKLHQLNICNVIGMQYTVLDRATSLFIQQFCQSIVQEKNIINVVQIARLAMQNLLNNNEQWQENEIGQWMIPNLYTCADEQQLFSQKPINPKIQTKYLKPLIGRCKQLFKLENMLLKYKKIWLYGVGGIGKTALAQALNQHFIAQHKSIIYLEIEPNQQIEQLPTDKLILVVSRHKPPSQNWTGFKLSAPSEAEFMLYAQSQGLAYPVLQLRLIYKILRGNYQGLSLLQGLPFSTEATVLRQQLCTVQRYLQAYQSIK